jgi:hypothetical protein
LRADHSRYVSSRRGEFQVVSVRAGQDVTNLVVRLTPGGVVTGRVVDENGEPLTGAHVEVQRLSYVFGRRRLLPVESRVTDDRGEYRIFGLQPGSYFVSASSTESRPGSAAIRSESKKLAYVKTYYPGTTEPRQATPVYIKGGEEATVDLSLTPTGTVSVSGRVLGIPPSQDVMLMLEPSGEEGGPEDEADVRNGFFNIDGVVPGDYLVNAYAPVKDHQNDVVSSLSLSSTIHIGSAGARDLRLVLSPPGTIHGRITGGNSKIYPKLMIGLVSPQRKSGSDSGMAEIKADGRFEIPDVTAGSYCIFLNADGPGAEDWFLESIEFAGQKLAGNCAQLSSGQMLELNISPAGAIVSGLIVDKDKQPLAGSTVVAVPEGARQARWDLYASATADQNGAFNLRGLAPGTYRLYAWTDIEQDSWFDPEVLKKAEPASLEITLSAGQRSLLPPIIASDK